MSNELDFLDETPATPTVSPADAQPTTDTVVVAADSLDRPSLDNPNATQPVTPEQRAVNAAARVARAEEELRAARRELNNASVALHQAEPEISLAERNAEARRIQAEIDSGHRAAVQALVDAGVDVARVVREGVRPKAPRKNPPQFFKP